MENSLHPFLLLSNRATKTTSETLSGRKNIKVTRKWQEHTCTQLVALPLFVIWKQWTGLTHSDQKSQKEKYSKGNVCFIAVIYISKLWREGKKKMKFLSKKYKEKKKRKEKKKIVYNGQQTNRKSQFHWITPQISWVLVFRVLSGIKIQWLDFKAIAISAPYIPQLWCYTYKQLPWMIQD